MSLNINNLITVKKFINIEELCGVTITEDYIIKIISEKQFPSRGFIEYYNKLLYDDSNYETMQKNNINLLLSISEYMEKMGLFINKKVLFDSSFTIISSSGIQLAMNSIIKYGNFENNNLSINEGLAILLIIMSVSVYGKYENDTNYNLSDKNLLVLSRITYFQFSNNNPQHELQRLKKIYDDYLNQKYIYDEFISTYGYSIEFFIVMNLVYYTMTISKMNYIARDICDILKDPGQFENFIRDNLFDFSKKEKIDIFFEIENRELLLHPLIKFDNLYFVVSPQEIVSKCSQILYFKIKNLFDGTNFSKQFRNDYGDAIEKYCYDIAKMHSKNNKFPYYNVFKSFDYTIDKESKQSSDFFIQQGKNLFIFEIKSTNRFDENISVQINSNSLANFENEINTKFINPPRQIDKRLDEIKTLSIKSELINLINKSNNLYYIIVSSEVININNSLWNQYLKNNKFRNTNKKVMYLNLNEFEYLMTAMKNHPKTISKIIDLYLDRYYNCNFYEFLSKYYSDFNFDKFDVFPDKNFEELVNYYFVNS